MTLPPIPSQASVSILRSKLKAASHCAATKGIRFYFCGVYLEFVASDTAHIVATDGNILFAGCVRTEHTIPPGTALIVPIEVVKRAVKGSGAIELRRMDASTWCLGSELFKPIDGVFPDWRRVIRHKGNGQPAQIDMTLGVRVQAACNEWFGVLPFAEHHGADYPHGGAVTFTGPDDSAIGVCMGLRKMQKESEGLAP